MLTNYQIELIHHEIDGENTPEASAEVRELIATQPEALALMTNLQSLDSLFGEVPNREPPPRVRQAIYHAVSVNSNASAGTSDTYGTKTITRWAARYLNEVSNFMGELMLTKKVLLGATTAVAAIAIIGYIVVAPKPNVFEAGTIGSGNDMATVQQAGRYHAAKKTDADVTLSNPEIQALLQNDKVLALVRSDVFREVMNNQAFHNLMSSAAYRELTANPAYRELTANPAYRELTANPAYRELSANPAYRELSANPAYRELSANPAYRELMANSASRELSANPAYRELSANPAYRELSANPAYRELSANPAYRELSMNPAYRELSMNPAYRELSANPAYRELTASSAFRELSRDQGLSQAFLSDAMRVNQ